ncbi:TPA: hypothetical protein ACGFBC_002176 [Clostridium perfringens]|uniref:hypothetical protein n=1 Tax=Clostridium perfringens TaxID=1502 RepID=UPI001C85885A|nr:hypothetical protein [Clostridium perfringens]ELC8437047.1 hypothetical protein [Clostridium perfringens]MDH5076735.1 hypothetical protein [Clostridium perfringens]MDM0633749.1 hypothetical protein [Clostridium perfringens]MDO6234129.1 hypothetical protein [Clostridium perfringens]WDT39114.1 hypothetical protein PVA22_12965 [Clostridium perfringens]
MSFLDKSIKSENVAKLSYDENLYDSSINRYYYSFFQRLKHTLDIKDINISEDDINKAGSHDETKQKYIEYLQKKGSKSMHKISVINRNYSRMKQLRKKADYLDVECSKEDADRFKKWFSENIEIITKS